MQVVRFFAFDSRSALPVVLILFNLLDWRVWLLFFINLAVFRYLEQRGLTVPAAIRNFRAWVVGKERPGLVGLEHKSFQDYG